MTDTCADGDHHGCAGVLSARTTAGGETVWLCTHHEAAHAFAWTGVLPCLRAMAATERTEEAS